MRSHVQAGSSSKRKDCHRCGRSFIKASHLERHIRTHVQERPFSCGTCGQAFARTDALQRHQRTVHRPSSRSGSQMDPGDTEGVSDIHESDAPHEDTLVPSLPDFPVDESFIINDTPQLFSQSDGSLDMNWSLIMSSNGPSTLSKPTPSGDLDMDELFATWLDHDGGSALASQALSQLLMDAAVDTAPPGPNGVDLTFAQDLGIMPTNSSTLQHSSYMASDNAVLGIPGPSTLLSTTPRHPSEIQLSADTWESGIPPTPETSVFDRVTMPSRITSPEQVVGELDIEGEKAPLRPDRVIPSMRFLDSCLHLYFRDFHPVFPIVHRASFQRDRTSPLLLLSMCSIGCMFFGTATTTELGLEIYERLHYVIVKTRDSKMATETSRIAVTLSALLGQSFSFLYGRPRQMLTAEAFHGTLCTMARRSGILRVVNQDMIKYTDIKDLDETALATRWRSWAQLESVKRVALGLTIHAAELTAYSGLPRLVPAQVDDTNRFSSALFEAETHLIWKEQLAHFQGENISTLSELDIFPDIAFLAQTFVNNHVRATITDPDDVSMQPQMFYTMMSKIAQSRGILSGTSSRRTSHLRVLWEYACVAYLSPIPLVEDIAGRGGNPSESSISSLRQWMRTGKARLARVHCGRLLVHGLATKDLAFLIPRCIFHATLILYCGLSMETIMSDESTTVNVMDHCDWTRLAAFCQSESRPLAPSSDMEWHVACNRGKLAVQGVISGQDSHLDLVTLRSAATRFLKGCTPWGIGDTLSDIISRMSI